MANLTPAYGVVTATNDRTVYVNSESQFPSQDGTTITLKANQHYEYAADISTSKYFVCEQGSSIASKNLDSHTLEYTGTGDMFSGTDVDFAIRQCKINCPNANPFAFTDTVGGVKKFICENVQITNSTKAGEFTNMALTQFTNSGAFNTTQGIELFGTSGTAFSVDKLNLASTSATFKAINYGASQFFVNEVDNLITSGPAGSVGISGLVSSGNVPAGRKAMVSGCDFVGDITPLENIEHFDIRWDFQGNPGINNSINVADVYITGGSETTTIVTQGVFEEIGVPDSVGVSWVSDIAERFTVGTDGVITYVGEGDIDIQITGTATVEKVGGGSDEIEARVAKNWTAGDTGYERSRAITQNPTPTSVPFAAIDTISTGDNFRVILRNNSSPGDIISQVTSFIIKG